MIRFALAAAAAASAMVLAAGQGAAQPASNLVEALKAGIVGQRFDGYLGFAATPTEALRREVNAVNIRRRSLYTGLAERRSVSVQVAGVAAGCTLLSRVAVGETYMLQDGVWRRRAAGQPAPDPGHCRK